VGDGTTGHIIRSATQGRQRTRAGDRLEPGALPLEPAVLGTVWPLPRPAPRGPYRAQTKGKIERPFFYQPPVRSTAADLSRRRAVSRLGSDYALPPCCKQPPCEPAVVCEPTVVAQEVWDRPLARQKSHSSHRPRLHSGRCRATPYRLGRLRREIGSGIERTPPGPQQQSRKRRQRRRSHISEERVDRGRCPAVTGQRLLVIHHRGPGGFGAMTQSLAIVDGRGPRLLEWACAARRAPDSDAAATPR
jgi:hypothetical protein